MEELKDNVSIPPTVINDTEFKKKYNQEYYQKNKDYWSQTFVCECGIEFKRANKNRHLKTKEHLKRTIQTEMKLPEVKNGFEINLGGFEKFVELITLKIGSDTYVLTKKNN